MKRLILLFGVISCWISMNGQGYQATSPSKCITQLGDTLRYTFTQAPPASGDATITFLYYGDLDGGAGSNNEQFHLYDENTNLVGSSAASSSQCGSTYDSVTFVVPRATVSNWTINGSIDFKVYSTTAVSSTLCALGSCAIIKISYLSVNGPNNAAVLSIDSPAAFCPGTEPIYATIGNAGTNRISSVTVNWSFNGVLQTPISHTSMLDTVGGSGSVTAQIMLGTKTFAANTLYDIKVWTSSPNSVADTSNLNDTANAAVTAALSGIYTINDALPTSGTNFNSFTAAFNTFAGSGLCGPVVLNVFGGPYNEQVHITNVNGSSATNTITVNGNGAMLVDSGNTGSNYAALLLDGADYVTIDSLNIRKIGTSNSAGVQFMNGADFNIIRNCNIEVDMNATSSTVIGMTFSGSATSVTTAGNNGNNNLIEGNTISGGYYSIRHYGSGTTAPIVGNQFIDNTIQDFRFYGMYNYYVENATIRGNDINRLNRSSISTLYALYCGYTTNNTEISNNWIHDGFAQATGSTSTFYGIYCFSSDATVGNEVKVFNNVINDNNSTGTHYVLYNSGSDGWWYYHNTVVENDPSASGTGITRMIYQTGTASNIEYKNNLFYLDRGTSGAQYLAYLNSTSSGITMDNNGFYYPGAGSGTKNFGYYGGNVIDFTAWQAVNSSAFDQNSATGDPFFVNPSVGDFTPAAAYYNNIGTNLLTQVATDINGTPRTTTPDPGAFEFSPPPGPDMSVSNIYSGGASCGTSTDIIVEVLNQGTDTVNSFTVNYTVNGTPGTGIPVTGVYPTGTYDSIVITGLPISGTAITTVIVTLNNIGPGIDTDAGNNKDTIDLRAGLSGTYTLNSGVAPSATNFTSFGSIENALITYGVCGPVVFNVTSVGGTYYHQLKLPEIQGASSVNTITINGNGNSLDFLGSSGERATVILNGADWITIDSLNINALGATTSEYGFGVSLTNNADHNTIRNCVIQVADDLTSSNYAGVTISGSLSSATTQGASGNYNTIEGNTIIGGYYGLSCVGSNSDSANGNVISNNVIQDYYYYGMYNYYNDHFVVDGNDVSRPNRTANSTTYFIYNYGVTSGRITSNRLHDPFPQNTATTSSAYGMYMAQFTGTASDPSIVANNVLYNMQSSGTQYGMYPNSANQTKFINNTVIMNDPATTATNRITRAFYVVGSLSDCDLANNIVYLDRNAGGTSTMMYFSTSPTSSTNINNNSYYAPNGVTFDFAYSGGSIPTFASWQNSTSFDANSVFGNPYLTNVALGDFTPQSAVLDGFGIDFSTHNTVDVNGVTRGTPPDVGAIEFTGAPCTGLSQIGTSGITATSGIVSWNPNPAAVTIEWGPQGFKQASITGTFINVPITDTSAIISGLGSNKCYDYYLTMNCSSSIPGAPPVMGPYTFCTDCAGGPLSGTYTIGGTPGATNFPTLDSAITALNGCGISAPVIFNMNGGTHNAINIGTIAGSNATNTITFNGAANLGDSIVATSQTAAIDLDGATYISFNGLYIENAGGNFVVWMHNGTRGISLMNSELIGSRTTSTFSTAVVAATSSATSSTSYGENVNGLTVSGCKIVGNYFGMSINGSSTTSKISDINLMDNDFEDQYYYGIRLYYTDSVEISGNTMPSFRNSFSYGMYMWYNDFVKVTKNAVYNANYGIYSYYTNQLATSAASTSEFSNNMLGAASTYGLYMYGNKYMNVFHNSIEASGTYGLYLSGSSVQGTTSSDNIDIRNNIISHSGSNYAIYIANTPFGTFTVDYNLYNTSGTNIAYNGAAYSNLAAWQLADLTKNVNSVETTPGFVSSTDLHVLGVGPNNIGDNSVGITTDFDGQARPAVPLGTVDIGADEYTPVTEDIALISGDFSKNGKCLRTNDTIVLEIQNVIGAIKNFGTTSLTATWNVTGPVNSSGTITVNTGTLAPQATMSLVGTPVDLSVPGVYTLDAYINPSSDNLTAINDTLISSSTITVYPVWEVNPTNTVVISNTTDTVELEAKSPFFGGSDFLITEICQFKSTGAPVGGWPSYLSADDYMEITGVPNSDLGGITLEIWNSSSMVVNYTFPPGTFMSPQGTAIIMTGQGATASQPSNFLYDGRGTSTSTWSSGTVSGYILKDNGVVIDAVGYNGHAFSATSGVTAADWSGNVASASGTAGIRLLGPDNNLSTDWSVVSSSLTQDPNSANANVPVPTPGSVQGFTWSLNGVTIDTLPNTVVGPYTAGGVFNYVAYYTSPCGVFTDTVTVIVNLPGGCPTPTNIAGTAPACDSLIFTWNSAADSSVVAYVATGGTKPAGTLVVGDSTYTVTGVTANTNYDFYVANICKGDTSAFSGPYTLNSGSAGAPVAVFTPTQALGSLTVNFDASGTSGNGNTYSWDFGDGSPAGSGSMTSHTYTTGGNYSVKLTVTNACGSSDTTIALNSVSMGENILGQNLRLFPNPAKNTLHIELDLAGTADITVRILDMSGKQVMNTVNDKTGERFEGNLDISELAQGVYMIEVTDGKYTAVRRLIKE